MENASKALLMAGGMLIAGLLIALIVYAWSTFSEYQTSKDELKNIENTAKFNEQFANYDREDVLGYEILSLLNKVIDYNERMTVDTKVGNDEGYKRVKITIILGSEDNRKKFTKNDDIRLFKEIRYEDGAETDKQVLTNANVNGVNGSSTKKGKRYSFRDKIIIENIEKIENALNVDENTLSNMAKNIDAMFKTEGEIKTLASKYDKLENDDERRKAVLRIMVTKFNSYMKKESDKLSEEKADKLILKDNGTAELEMNETNETNVNVYEALCTYYEYMQFKRGIFKCNKIEYDDGDTGRVVGIEFEFTGDIK